MDIEIRHGVRSTFFFLNESKRTNPLKPATYKLTMGGYNIHDRRIVEIVRKLSRGGWEIGVHGSFDSYLKEGLLAREKRSSKALLAARFSESGNIIST